MSECRNRVSSLFFFSSRRRHTRFDCDWSSDVCSSDLRFERERLENQKVQRSLDEIVRLCHTMVIYNKYCRLSRYGFSARLWPARRCKKAATGPAGPMALPAGNGNRAMCEHGIAAESLIGVLTVRQLYL